MPARTGFAGAEICTPSHAGTRAEAEKPLPVALRSRMGTNHWSIRSRQQSSWSALGNPKVPNSWTSMVIPRERLRYILCHNMIRPSAPGPKSRMRTIRTVRAPVAATEYSAPRPSPTQGSTALLEGRLSLGPVYVFGVLEVSSPR